MNKKGLATGIIALTIFIFIFAITSLFALKMWNETNEVIQNLDNETVPQNVKDKIDALTSKMEWGDKLFMLFFVLLLASYIISSVTIPVDRPIFFFIFIIVLIFTTIIAMFLSNSWQYLIDSTIFANEVGSLTLTSFVMRYLPIISFVIGIVGAILFYSRNFLNPQTGQTDGFE